MNSSLSQYTDLYRNHSDLLFKSSVPLVNSLREKAYEAVSDMSLPKKGSENYETTDLEAILAPDYGLNLMRVGMDANLAASFHCGVPSISNAPVLQVNDLIPCQGNVSGQSGVFVGNIGEFCKVHAEVAEKYFGSLAPMSNPIVALNSMLAQDALVVYVAPRVNADKPIQIVNILNSSMPLMAVRRLLVVVGDDASAKILTCDHTQTADVPLAALQTIEIAVGKNASLDFYDMEESSEKTSRLSALYLKQEEGSNVGIDNITLYNGNTRNEFHTRFDGENASLRLYGMGIEDRSRHLDNYSVIEHAVPGCNTLELFKYVVDDEAVGAFAGLINVAHGAEKTEAYQSNRNIVGSDKARMFSKPQLEIYADDVKCSHGSATGQLDDMQVFYMRTRGIPEEEAKLLLKQAFMADVVDAVGIPSLKDRLRILVEKRFAGTESSCSGCSLKNTASSGCAN